MSYDETLAERITAALFPDPAVTTRKMFGGFCFMYNGNMLCGVINSKLMARVGKDQYEASLKQPHTTVMDFTGRPLTGMIYVEPEGIKTQKQLQAWVDASLHFVKTLPAK